MKDIKPEIQSLLAAGMSKGDIYEKIKGEEDDEELRSVLSQIAYPKDLNRIKWKQRLLVLIWCQFFLIEFINFVVEFSSGSMIGSFSVTCILFYSIVKKKALGYSSGMIWFVWGLIKSVKEVGGLYSEDKYILVIFLAFMFMDVIGVYLMKDIKRILFPYFGIINFKRNSEGSIIFE